MEPRFEVTARMARPAAAVYEAVADPATLSRYFTTGGARGRLETGTTAIWDFADFPGAFPVEVVEAVPAERIVLRWGSDEEAAGTYRTTVTFRFEALPDDRTAVTVAEEGWRDTPAGLKASYSNCMGWSQMLCAMKVWLEHGINLREGIYR